MRPVGEHMTEMPAARGAHPLGPRVPEGSVRVLVDDVVGRRRVERGPAAARVVLGVGAEELGPAAGAVIRPLVEDVVVLAGERTLGALLPEDMELLGCQLLPPLLLCFLDRFHAESSP